MFVVCLIPFLLLGTTVYSHDPNIALKFGYDLTSYIMLDLDMSPLEEEVTVCAWVKQMGLIRKRSISTLLHYRTADAYNEIVLADDLHYAYMLNEQTPHSTAPPRSEWYHVCLTFSYSTRTRALFYNGEKIGSEETPAGRKFSIATGSLILGQYQYDDPYKMGETFISGFQFGGEIAKLNIFSRSLTDQEVAGMYSSGICSSYEESLWEDTFLSWNTLLDDSTEKHGNIAKINLTCPSHSHTLTPSYFTTEGTQPTQDPEDTCNNRWGFLRLSEFKEQVQSIIEIISFINNFVFKASQY